MNRRPIGPAGSRQPARVQHWLTTYPALYSRFKDSDGRPPQHTFFFPIEEYEPEYLDALADLCRQGFGEVEIHLHHDKDTAEGLRQKLVEFRDLLVQRHGLLSRHKETGATGLRLHSWQLGPVQFPPGRPLCGVNNELDILRETGCYVDMTFPSAPGAQSAAEGQLDLLCLRQAGPAALPRNRLGRRHLSAAGQQPDAADRPVAAGLGQAQMGPACRGWRTAACNTRSPPMPHRIDNWLRAGVQVPTRPDWFFVKLHAHGAPEESHDTLLGEPMVRLHEELARRAQEDRAFHYHYVTAREMYNLVKAAEAGFQGSVAEARDFCVPVEHSCGWDGGVMSER